MKDGSHKEYIRLFRQTADPEQAAAAIGAIYALCERDFSNYIRKFVPDDETAADLLSDMMVIVLMDVQKVSEKLEPKNWLFGIVRNLIGEYLRSTKRMPTVAIEDLLDMVGGKPADDDLHYNELVQAILEIAEGMSPKRSEVLLMRWLEGLDAKEIAKRNATSPNTVKKQLKEAIRQAGKALKKRWIFNDSK